MGNDPNETLTTASNASLPSALRSEEDCPSCGGPMRLRNAKPFPVLLQAAFGISFLAFLWAQGSGKLPTKILWVWSALQILIGIFLVRARYAAAKKVFICLRCGAPLR